jgi:hypothetical protein
MFKKKKKTKTKTLLIELSPVDLIEQLLNKYPEKLSAPTRPAKDACVFGMK